MNSHKSYVKIDLAILLSIICITLVLILPAILK